MDFKQLEVLKSDILDQVRRMVRQSNKRIPVSSPGEGPSFMADHTAVSRNTKSIKAIDQALQELQPKAVNESLVSLEEKSDSATRDIGSLKDQVSGLRKEIVELSSKSEILSGLISSQNVIIQKANSQIAELQAKVKTLESKPAYDDSELRAAVEANKEQNKIEMGQIQQIASQAASSVSVNQLSQFVTGLDGRVKKLEVPK